jgi:hypothetical protein
VFAFKHHTDIASEARTSKQTYAVKLRFIKVAAASWSTVNYCRAYAIIARQKIL